MLKRVAAVVLAYALITPAIVSPLINFRHLDSASYEGDARLLIWTLAWNAHALLTGTPLFQANIYYPEPQAMAYAEHHFGIGIFGLPLYAATSNPVLTYWVLWLLAFVLNALAMHALAWRVTRDHVAAFAAGCIYAFCFFRMHHAHGHIQLLWTWMLPLIPLTLDAWLERATPARAAGAAAVVVAATLTSWYLAVFGALLSITSVACLVRGRRISAAHVVQALPAAISAALIVAWFARPYLTLTPGPPAEAVGNSADLRGYLLPPENTWIGQLLERHTSIDTRWIWGEQTTYVSGAVLVLTLIGVWRLVRGRLETQKARIAAAVVITGVIALSLSLGPTPSGLSPFDLLSRIPGLGLLRAPARFALLVMMACATLAAFGVVWLRERSSLRGTLVSVILLVVFFLESFVVAFPAGRPPSQGIPEVYRALAGRPRGPVISLPTYRATPEAFRESDYLLFSTVHWYPIVNGFGRQEPPDHGSRMTMLAAFPSEESLRMMRTLGIRYVVVHTARASELVSRLNEARAAARLVHSSGGDYLFELASANE